MAAPHNRAQLTGIVVDVTYQKGKPSIFIIKSANSNNRYRVSCKFFCPVHQNDGISLIVSNPPDHNNEHHTLFQPFVQVPTDKNSIMTCFISALRNTGFGAISSQSLYEKLEELANIAGYGEKAKARLDAMPSLDFLPKIEDLKPWIAGATPETGNGKYTGDGVISYLSDISSKYCKTYEDADLKVLVEGTKLQLKQIKMLMIWWNKKRSLRRLYLLTLTNEEIQSCRLDHDTIYNICIDNPYRLAPISVEKCKIIMTSLGKIPTLEQEICGSIVRKMYAHIHGKGWSRTPIGTLRRAYPQFNSFKDELIKDYFVIFVDNFVYLQHQYIVETALVKFFDHLIRKSAEAERDEIAEKAKGPILEDDNTIFKCKTITDEQKTAIFSAFKFHISMITGGGGVGKTITLSEVEHNLRIREIPYICCSFTGKAVARIQEVLKSRTSSMTMHRLISRSGTMCKFKYVLVDEISMVDAYLLYRFIQTFSHDYKFIFFGDANQLEPIGWGAVMIELIASGRVPVTYLTKNHRIIPHKLDTIDENTLENKDGAPGEEKFDREILVNANRLVDPRRDLDIPFTFNQGTSFFQLDGGINTIETILIQLRDAGIDAKRISIICPFVQPCIELNKSFQQIFLDGRKRYQYKEKIWLEGEKKWSEVEKTWIEGDRIKMKENNYDINIFNGTEGYIIELKDEGIIIEFPDGIRHLFYWKASNEKEEYKQKNGWANDENPEDESKELTVSMLQHIVAGTVHDNQGSERDFYIGYIPKRNVGSFLHIKMIYTEITRSKRAFWMVGDAPTISDACNRRPPKRVEGLGIRLKELKDDLQAYLDPYTKPLSVILENDSASSLTADNSSYDDIFADDDDEMMRMMSQ